MLRRLKKFAVCSSVIVAGQASRVDDAPFAGQDESEDAKGLLRRLSECEDASYVQIFDRCIDPDTTKLRVHPASPTPARATASAPQGPLEQRDHRPIPTEIGLLTALKKLRVPRVPDARRGARPRRHRDLGYNMFSTIPTEIGMLTALKYLRVPPASPTPGAARDRPSASSLDYNEIDTIPTEIGELAALEGLRVPPAPTPGAARDRPTAYLNKNKITGTFPLALCDVEYCSAKSGNDLVAPCGTKGCCDLEKGETCSSSGGGDACSGLAKKTCKKTAGCAYKKKTCSSSCSELSKGKCKKTDGCDYKKKQCSAASSCSGLSKKECKTTDGCDYKKKQCSAASSCSGLSKKECKTTDGCDYEKKKDKCLAK
ncbi:hypothetical protein JL722_395 [Aureococcus anophagefferens]|nr:hypothetical protein JL722_395 [Aureococcus anophagefferens]